MRARILVLVALVLVGCGRAPTVVHESAPPPTTYASTPNFNADLNRAITDALAVKTWNEAKWYGAAPKSAPIRRTSHAFVQNTSAPDGSVWDRIAACESGGNWADNTGNGYYGGLQMNMSFWHSYGGDEFAARPDLATREQQIVVAERAVAAGRGYGPWPTCGRRA